MLRLRELLVSRLVASVASESARRSIARCLLMPGIVDFAEIARLHLGSGQLVQLLLLLDDLMHVINSRNGALPLAPDVSRWVEALPSPAKDLATPLLQPMPSRSWPLSPEATQAIANAPTHDDAELALKVTIATHAGAEVREEIERLLATQGDFAVVGIEAAIRMQMNDLVDASLSHARGIVRAPALLHAASRSAGVLSPTILGMSRDKSRYVRDALVDRLAADPRPEYLETLEALADDSWSTRGMHFQEDHDRPIARKAAAAFQKVPLLDDDLAARLYKLAAKSEDPEHRQKLLDAMAQNGTPEIRERLLRAATQVQQTCLDTSDRSCAPQCCGAPRRAPSCQS